MGVTQGMEVQEEAMSIVIYKSMLSCGLFVTQKPKTEDTFKKMYVQQFPAFN